MKGLSIVVILFCASLFLKREIINQKKTHQDVVSLILKTKEITA